MTPRSSAAAPPSLAAFDRGAAGLPAAPDLEALARRAAATPQMRDQSTRRAHWEASGSRLFEPVGAENGVTVADQRLHSWPT